MNRLTLITAYKMGTFIDLKRINLLLTLPTHTHSKNLLTKVCVTRGRRTTQHAVYHFIICNKLYAPTHEHPSPKNEKPNAIEFERPNLSYCFRLCFSKNYSTTS